MDKLKKGDKVAIVSLSSGILGEEFIKHELELGVKRIKELGLVPVFMDNSLRGLETLKNNPSLRADDLKQAFSDNSIKAIFSAIGGDDSYRLIPFLLSDNEFIKNVKENPKIFCGYSDTTTIHLLLNKLGLNTFYGPALLTDFAEFEKDMLPYTKNGLKYFFDAPKTYEIKSSEYWYKERTDFSVNAVGSSREKIEEKRGYEVISGKGKVKGELYGGCIDVIYKLALSQFNSNIQKNSTKSEIDEIISKYPIICSKNELSNKILFLETSDEKPSPEQYRTMIRFFKENELFSKISGLLIGKPIDEVNYEEYKQILKEELSEFNFPILMNLNFGHSYPRMVLPYGALAEIDVNSKSLTLLNSTLV